MSESAQSALEYLMTYGWTLIVVTLIIGVLIFVVFPQETDVSFGSDDVGILVKDSFVGSGGEVDLVLLNGNASSMIVNSFYLLGDFVEFGGATVNGRALSEITSSSPLVVSAGAELVVDNVFYAGPGLVDGSVNIEYVTRFGLSKSAAIAGVGSAASTSQSIDSCRTISSSGNYTLSNDLYNTSGYCIEITADDVVLNCKGRRIIGTGASNYLVSVTGDNVTVTNCDISGVLGLMVAGGSGASINNNTVATSMINVTVSTTSAVQVRNNDLVGASFSMYLFGISDSSITNNTISESASYGAFLSDGTGTMVVSNNSFCGSATSDVSCSSFTASGSGNRLDTISGTCGFDYLPCS